MDLIYNQNILEQQYKDSTNLNARVEVHNRFSANPNLWYPWVFNRLELSGKQRILEVGCGMGGLWLSNPDRIPGDIRLYLSDYSSGMVKHSRASFQKEIKATFLQANAQFLAFQQGVFDRVVANHMLYHVPDIDQALQEIRRVLALGGFLLAATNGRRHMQDLYDLIAQVYPQFSRRLYSTERFGLETGKILVENVFSRVEVQEFPDSLWVTEAQPLVRYACSLWDAPLDPDFAVKINGLFEHIIREKGGIFIQKTSGIIRAWK